MASMTASMQPSGELGAARLLGRGGGGKGEHEVGGSEPGIGKIPRGPSLLDRQGIGATVF